MLKVYSHWWDLGFWQAFTLTMGFQALCDHRIAFEIFPASGFPKKVSEGKAQAIAICCQDSFWLWEGRGLTEKRTIRIHFGTNHFQQIVWEWKIVCLQTGFTPHEMESLWPAAPLLSKSMAWGACSKGHLEPSWQQMLLATNPQCQNPTWHWLFPPVVLQTGRTACQIDFAPHRPSQAILRTEGKKTPVPGWRKRSSDHKDPSFCSLAQRYNFLLPIEESCLNPS